MAVFEFRRFVSGVFPNLIGKRSQIHFGVCVAVQDAGLFVIEVEQLLLFALILEKCFVRANDFAVFMQSLAHPLRGGG